MRKWNEDFYHDWKNMDDLSFHVEIDRIPRILEAFSMLPKYESLVNKVSEADKAEVTVPGTRRPSTRAERRKATRRAKIRRQELARYSDNFIMPNSGKVKNTGFRSYEKGAKVYHRNKKIQVESTVSPFNPLDGDFLDFNPDTIGSYETAEADGRLWKKADKIAASEDNLWEEFEAELERDSALLEENLKNWEWEEPSPVGIVEPEEKLKAQVDALNNQIANLMNEVNRLNSFLQEFNLQKLYEKYLEEHNHEFF